MTSSIAMKDFYPLAQQEEIAILDVRESYEYEMGHVPKAKNVPLSQLANAMKTLDPEKVLPHLPIRSALRKRVRPVKQSGLQRDKCFRRHFSLAR